MPVRKLKEEEILAALLQHEEEEEAEKPKPKQTGLGKALFKLAEKLAQQPYDASRFKSHQSHGIVPYGRVVLMTPILALELLGRMAMYGKRRKVRWSRVDDYSLEAQLGRFMVGPPIMIDWNGFPFDGQHRLLMVVKNGVPVPMLLIFDLNPDVAKIVDQGGKRNMADVATLNLKEYDHARERAKVVGAIKGLFLPAQRNITSHLFEHFYLASKEEVDWVFRAIPCTKSNLGHAQVRAGLAVAYRAYPAEMESFVEGLRSGVGLVKDSPVYVLRKFLLEGGMEKARAENGSESGRRRPIAIRVLNAALYYVEKKRMTRTNYHISVMDHFTPYWRDEIEALKPAVTIEVDPEVKAFLDGYENWRDLDVTSPE
jgi:hypothetical protein